MTQDGYTAVEALTALAMLGLAVGGLTTGLSIVGAHQYRAREGLQSAERTRAIDRAAESLLVARGPFRSDDAAGLTGSPAQLQFNCGQARCGLSIAGGALEVRDAAGAQRSLLAPSGEAMRLTYVGTRGTSEIWPPVDTSPVQTLKAVIIEAEGMRGHRPLTIARVERQQRADCEYDIVAQDCRKRAP